MRIAIALFDGVEELDFAGPWEVLAYWAREVAADAEVFTVATSLDPVTAAKGLRVLPDRTWDDAGQIDVMDDTVRLVGDGLFHVPLCLAPIGRIEDFSAEEILGEHPCESIQPHYFGVPHAHHVQTARVLGVDLEALECLSSNVTGVLNPGPGALRQRILAQGAGEIEMALGVPGIRLHGAPGVELRALEVICALVVVAFVGSQIDRGSRRFPEGLVVLGIHTDRRLVVLQSSGSMHGDVFFVAKRNVFGCRLGARN